MCVRSAAPERKVAEKFLIKLSQVHVARGQRANGQSIVEEEKRRMHHVGHTQAQNVEEGNAIIVSNAAPLFLSPSREPQFERLSINSNDCKTATTKTITQRRQSQKAKSAG